MCRRTAKDILFGIRKFVFESLLQQFPENEFGLFQNHFQLFYFQFSIGIMVFILYIYYKETQENNVI